MSTAAASSPQTEVLAAPRTRLAPLWNVVLLDDDDHTYQYVIEMLHRLFGYDPQRAYRLACEVDEQGRVVLATLLFEQAEFKQQQIHSYGRDWRLAHSKGSMTAVLEPVPRA
ncbi:MAG: ATP-dependent Clp protease adaptor ClpS [Phycisphaerales bacterium]|nr:ATP-dependent Clp protease adaptor ClpS [Phycisphaerales bacterium]